MTVTPEMKAAAKQVNAIWQYKADPGRDKWSFKSPGDCENYSLLICAAYFGGNRAAKSALWRGKARIWYVTTDTGEGHAILELNGRYICNRTRHWCDSFDEMRIQKAHYRFPRAVVALRIALG